MRNNNLKCYRFTHNFALPKRLMKFISHVCFENLVCERHIKAFPEFKTRIIGDHQYPLHEDLLKARSYTPPFQAAITVLSSYFRICIVVFSPFRNCSTVLASAFKNFHLPSEIKHCINLLRLRENLHFLRYSDSNHANTHTHARKGRVHPSLERQMK